MATTAASPTIPPSSGPAAELCGTDWLTSAEECGSVVGDRFLFQCPPDGRFLSIWGTDVYTSDSRVCTAAVHAGLLTFAAGGVVTIEIRPGQDSYLGSTRNGVTSSEYASWPSSFAFVGGAIDLLAALIAHIPAQLQGDCGEVTSFDAGANVSVQCINIPSVAGYAVYTQFDSLANLNTAYQSKVDFFGVGTDGDDCRVEPSEGGYTIGGTPAGQIVCNTYAGIDPDGLILYWTHEGLLILSSLAMYGGTFQEMYDIWRVAGPNP